MKEYHSIFGNFVIRISSLREFMANKFTVSHSFRAREKARKPTESACGGCERGLRKGKARGGD